MAREHITVRLDSADFPCDRLWVREMTGKERIGQLFAFDLLLVNRDPGGPSAQELAGALVSLVFLEQDNEIRRIHGMIARATDLLDTETDFGTYRVRVVPRAHRLTLVRTQDIYVEASVPAIIKRKLDLAGLGDDCDLRLSAGFEKRYPVQEFVVQYDETDLAFVSRLAEHHGISFFFEHDSGVDRIVFTDLNAGFRPAEGGADARFTARGEHNDVYRLEATAELIPSLYAVGDYNYETPQVDLSATTELAFAYGGGVVEFGTNHKDPAGAEQFARIRAEQSAATALVFTGEAALCSPAAGARFNIEGHPRFSPCDLLVTEVEHRARQVTLAAGGDEADVQYTCVFQAIPFAVPYRPPRVTPRPRIHGVMSGIVEPKPGGDAELPWIDEHGRYIIRVLFDTAPPGERRASLPIRMSQPHAGPNYGFHFPLRPGIEVLLAFLGGDPDRPVIVGAVPNAVTPNPVVDREATYHRIRTSSGVQIEIDDGR